MNRAGKVFGGERGAALLIALIALVLLSALGVSLSLVMDTEVRIASNFAASREAIYAADGALEIAAQELLSVVSDWNDVLDGMSRSVLSTGLRQKPPVARRAEHRPYGCHEPGEREPRPWGANNPRWQLFAYGPLGGAYVIVWAGDDPAETDGDPGPMTSGQSGRGYRGASGRGVRRRQGAYCSGSHGAPVRRPGLVQRRSRCFHGTTSARGPT